MATHKHAPLLSKGDIVILCIGTILIIGTILLLPAA
jgi:hypothetical protein